MFHLVWHWVWIMKSSWPASWYEISLPSFQRTSEWGLGEKTNNRRRRATTWTLQSWFHMLKGFEILAGKHLINGKLHKNCCLPSHDAGRPYSSTENCLIYQCTNDKRLYIFLSSHNPFSTQYEFLLGGPAWLPLWRSCRSDYYFAWKKYTQSLSQL